MGDHDMKNSDHTSSRRKFLTATGTASIVGFAGCTGTGNSGGGNSSNGGNSSGGKGNTITLSVIDSSYKPLADELRKLFRKFEKQEGNVKIQYDRVGFSKAKQKASQAFAAGDPYDIMALASPGNDIAGVESGLFQPINDVIKDRGGSDYWKKQPLIKIDGDYYFVPTHGSVVNLIWREDLFEEVGAPKPPFKNWEEYKKAAKMLTKPNENQYGMPVFLATNHFTGVWPLEIILGNGGHVVDENGDIVYDSKEVAEALSFIKELDQYSPESAHNSNIPNMRTPLYKGQYAMTWYSTNEIPSDIEQYNPSLKGKVHVAPVPARDENHTPVARMGGLGYGISSKTKHPDMAKKLVKVLSSKKNITKALEAHPTAQVPMVKDVIDDKLWNSNKTFKEYKPLYKDLLQIANKYGRIVAVNENPGHVNPITGQALSDATITKSVQDVVLNDMEPMAAAKKWAKKMREEYK